MKNKNNKMRTYEWVGGDMEIGGSVGYGDSRAGYGEESTIYEDHSVPSSFSLIDQLCMSGY